MRKSDSDVRPDEVQARQGIGRKSVDFEVTHKDNWVVIVQIIT